MIFSMLRPFTRDMTPFDISLNTRDSEFAPHGSCFPLWRLRDLRPHCPRIHGRAVGIGHSMAQHTLILVLNGDGGGFGLKGERMRKYAISKCLRATAESVPCRPPFHHMASPLARPVETGGFHHVLHQCLLKRTSCTNHAKRACLTTKLCKVLRPCGL